VASQLGLAVERARLQHAATNAEILRGTDELKTALLHAVSHNLRTPLASIIAFSQVVSGKPTSPGRTASGRSSRWRSSRRHSG
jgi:K+-sensing histidine kinase KdpD